MSKLADILLKFRFIEERQRSIKAIKQQIQEYESQNLELASQSSEVWTKRKINDNDLKINTLKWTIYDE